MKENRELKEKLAAKDSNQQIDQPNSVKPRPNSLLEGQLKSLKEAPIKTVEQLEPEPLVEAKPKRRKIFGIF